MRRKLTRGWALAAVPLILVGCGGASASKTSSAYTTGSAPRATANVSEPAVIARAAGLGSVPSRCLGVAVDGNYAGVTFNNHAAQSCQQYAANGITVLQRESGEWREVWAGSEGYPPIPRASFNQLYKHLTSYLGG